MRGMGRTTVLRISFDTSCALANVLLDMMELLEGGWKREGAGAGQVTWVQVAALGGNSCDDPCGVTGKQLRSCRNLKLKNMLRGPGILHTHVYMNVVLLSRLAGECTIATKRCHPALLT